MATSYRLKTRRLLRSALRAPVETTAANQVVGMLDADRRAPSVMPSKARVVNEAGARDL
jgi:hypothetical protein